MLARRLVARTAIGGDNITTFCNAAQLAMSIYRTSDRYLESDVHAYETVEEERLAPRLSSSPVSIQHDKYQHLRKATPVNRPLFRTLMWVASLPPDIRPTALLLRYARIANLIAAAWRDQKCFCVYMESLLTDNRGNRQGFPPDVLSELVAVRRYHDALKDSDLTWTTLGKRG